MKWGEQNPPLLGGPNCPPQPRRSPLSDPQAQGSPESRLPRARKLARPQGFPFIARFPLNAVPLGAGLRTFLPLPPLPPPHPCPRNPSRVQVSNPAEGPSFDPGVPAPISQLGRGAAQEENPPGWPHSLALRSVESFSMERAGPPGGGARRARRMGSDPAGVAQRRSARNSPAFQSVGAGG